MTNRESSQQHNVSRNAKWAIIQTIVSAGVLFVLYRFLLKELGPEKLGLWSLILASTSIARIGELGFSNATLRFVGKYVGAGNPGAAAEILETSLLTIALPLGVLLAIAIPLLGSVLPWVVPSHHMVDALAIVPWAMFALWLGIIGGLVQSAIDGSGRMDQRNMVLIVTNGIYLALATNLTPLLGLKGVAIAQVLQAATSLLIMWWLAKRHLNALPLIPFRWSRVRFKEILGFAVNMQIGGIAGMLIEPLTKAFVSRFGGLELLAYYEMANQVITRTRSVLIAGFQSVTPQYAISQELTAHREIFIKSQTAVLNLGIPFMAIVIIAFPLISYIWSGTYQVSFIHLGQLVGMTWLIITSLMPAYFYLTGTGRGVSIAIAHVAALIGTLALGWGSGEFGPTGPIAGWAASLIAANIYLNIVAINKLFLTVECFKKSFIPLLSRVKMLAIVCIGTIVANITMAYMVHGLIQEFLLFSISVIFVMSVALYSRPRKI